MLSRNGLPNRTCGLPFFCPLVGLIIWKSIGIVNFPILTITFSAISTTVTILASAVVNTLMRRFIGVEKSLKKNKKNIGSKNGLEKACKSGDFAKKKECEAGKRSYSHRIGAYLDSLESLTQFLQLSLAPPRHPLLNDEVYDEGVRGRAQPSNSENLPSQPLSNPWRRLGTLFPYTNQEGWDDALLNEEDVESLHECLEEVEEENETQVAENVDQEMEDNDKEPNRMENVHFASSEATPSKLPSELQFEWVNLPNLNFIGPQHYALLETDDQLGALDGVLNKKETESLELNASKFITCGESEFKSYSEHLHKLHNNRAKVGAFSLKKHLGPWQLQEKLVDSHSKGWTNHVWDLEKSFKNHNFWGVITCVEAFRNLLSMNWDPLEPTKFKHWWGFKDEFKHKPP
ncbi:hypothetical protein PIB30_024045 [Stylosanthes scabra]|uniref:Uncharacterized protein n=1 Tax=Stylosanthes scabra TaxID=79078 RepID=A0ABU6R9W1_9FABA|nr:hypothetical protein [Stylosanthes scabra]